MPTVGILALQGDFDAHNRALAPLDVTTLLVKTVADLDACDGLIIPGGESTTMTKLINGFELYDDILSFVESHPVMGTCAGMIMLSKDASDSRVKPFKVIDLSVDRNAYGSQKESFEADITLSEEFETSERPFRAVFIRAPRVSSWNEADIIPLASYNDVPIIFRQGRVLALSFHPELTDDSRIHSYFVDMIRESLVR
ncbi:pyridoxal 5'-phosphate synthase glutaminase subunit PdxT [bacterium]|nr:pyridoxal 5'-phosphate synthase glutaminase subunit PdxT [bacterium]